MYGVRSYDTKIIQPPGGISIRKVEGEILTGKTVTPIHVFFYSCAISHSGVDFQIEIHVLVPHFLQMEPMIDVL